MVADRDNQPVLTFEFFVFFTQCVYYQNNSFFLFVRVFAKLKIRSVLYSALLWLRCVVFYATFSLHETALFFTLSRASFGSCFKHFVFYVIYLTLILFVVLSRVYLHYCFFVSSAFFSLFSSKLGAAM